MKNLWLVYLHIIYLSSILKNMDDYSGNSILNDSLLVIYKYMYKYIVDVFCEQQMHINTVTLYFTTDQWMKTCTASKYATKVYSSLQNMTMFCETTLCFVVQSSVISLQTQRRGKCKFPVLWQDNKCVVMTCVSRMCAEIRIVVYLIAFLTLDVWS